MAGRGLLSESFASEPSLAIGAQVLIANHLVEDLKPLIPQSRPAVGLIYGGAAEHLELIRKLQRPSIVAMVSVSASLLRTARSLFAPAIGRKHTLSKVLVTKDAPVDLSSADLVFCDTITISIVRSRRKVHYRLIAGASLEQLASSLGQR